MADDIQPDQETYDRLIAAGESERTARAKAKSVAARKARGVNRAFRAATDLALALAVRSDSPAAIRRS